MKILVLEEHADRYPDYLSHLPDDVHYATQPGNAAQEYDVLLAQPDLAAEYLRAGGKTRWIQSTWAGIRPLADLNPTIATTVTGVKDIFGPQMAEYVFTYILAEIRNPDHYHELQKEARWQQSLPGTLTGGHMTIVGTGSIGSHIGRVAQSFGLTVTGVSRSGVRKEGFSQVFPASGLNHAVADADYVVLVLPDTEAATHVLHKEVFLSMQCKPMLFNVGRGSSIEQEALIEALRDGTVRSAVLDVFPTEPLPTDNPLWQEPGVVITPHISAVSLPADIAQIFLTNLEKFRVSQQLDYVIDLGRGY